MIFDNCKCFLLSFTLLWTYGNSVLRIRDITGKTDLSLDKRLFCPLDYKKEHYFSPNRRGTFISCLVEVALTGVVEPTGDPGTWPGNAWLTSCSWGATTSVVVLACRGVAGMVSCCCSSRSTAPDSLKVSSVSAGHIPIGHLHLVGSQLSELTDDFGWYRPPLVSHQALL